ncbi:YheC/YheD family protein [Paenibacillus cisolokensis]|uniref:YheC/YheD family protein n=1 Tax=Paenibacillus cisolokensis TaxID=1658519 RepID=UPI003558D65E
MNDPILSRHVPKTYWYRAARLRNMLKLYSSVYIKPDIGRKGNGVIRVRKLNASQVEISHRDRTDQCSMKELKHKIRKLMTPGKNTWCSKALTSPPITAVPSTFASSCRSRSKDGGFR